MIVGWWLAANWAMLKVMSKSLLVLEMLRMVYELARNKKAQTAWWESQ
jgi:hypothetical protein